MDTQLLASVEEDVATPESIIATSHLSIRRPHAPDFEEESKAMSALARQLWSEPNEILLSLSQAGMKLCRADSAGFSLIEEENDEAIFRWHAVCGSFAANTGGSTQRNFSPCGIVVDKGPQLFIRPERYYSYLKAATPWIEEALIIPFGANGQIVGTFWVLKTQKDSHFDSEDLRLLTTLGNFAAAAYMIRIAMEKSEKLEASQKTALEIAEAANLSQDRFLAVLSHELRTPLTPVLMNVSARIMDSETSSNMRADFMMIRRNIELQTRLIDDLLDLSGIRSGKLTLHKERVDLNEAIVQVQAICLSLVQERGIQMHVNLDVSNPIIDADAARIQQVLWNVIKNATKYTAPHGNIYITSHHTADGMAKIKIRDDGIGMEPGDIESIFTAFEQRDHHLGGLGLGLSISRAIVDMHGGNIHATSGGKGKGSEFTINLPMDFSKDAEMKGEGNEQSTVAKPLNVLIVEDHMDTAAVLMHLLKGIGHEVRAASTVKDALEIAKTHKFDLIISDLGLPDETGHTLMREIKKIQNIKGIAMSGYGMPEDIMKSLEAGFSAHIVKPFGMNLLEQTIRRITTSF